MVKRPGLKAETYIQNPGVPCIIFNPGTPYTNCVARLCRSLFVTQQSVKAYGTGRLPLLFLFLCYSDCCNSAVIYRFQSPAKGKLLFVVLAGVQALDVSALREQLVLPWEGCQC